MPPAIGVPGAVQEGVDRFATALGDALGDHLISIILYGGLAKGEYSPRSSNVNLLLVVDTVTVDLLDRAVAPVVAAERDSRIALMILGESDLARSAEVFPVKFLDIQKSHRVVWGRDVFSGLTISRDRLQFRCRQELVNLLLRLREFYLRRSERGELIEKTLTSAISSFLTSLRVLLILRGRDAPAVKGEIVDAASREFGLPADVLKAVLDVKTGRRRAGPAELRALYGKFMAAAERAVEIVEQS